ncbi:hypothetical protein GJ744_005737 [Endocarpon pusillum]|uniref:Vacuolar protein sorting-associated protein 33A n=1 Tax=Endocarpon pusillum TaxID=364733 RepID=A0A8H7AQ24_9EURO|nr:hypothetical protein GJ744_005737 [Endocarpon pusillum]
MAVLAVSEADHLRTKARKDLLNLLEGVRGRKNLVISKSLTGPTNLFVNFSTLKEYGVDKLFVLENGNTDSSQRNIAYLVHGEEPSQVQATAEQIKKLLKNGSVEHEISIFWVPRRTLVSNKILEDEGVLGDVNVSEFPMYFLPLEDDVLSLELEDAFMELYLKGNPTSIFLASRALMLIQQRHGFFPRILGKGDNARRLTNLLVRGRKELDVEDGSSYGGGARATLPSATLDSLIIIDRDVDFATLFLTQLTYEGLIEETVGIQQNQAEVDSSVTGTASQNSTQPPQGSTSSNTSPPSTTRQNLKTKIKLDSSDSLYSQLRFSNFAIVGSLLNKVARRLESDYEVRHSARTTTELGDFVRKLPVYQQEHQSLRIHTNLAEEIVKQTRSEIFTRVLEVQQNIAAGTDATYQHDTVEELIARDVPLPTILRLLCLESCISGGLRPRDLEKFKRQMLQAYGYQNLLTLDALEKMELLQPRSSANALLLPIPGTGNTGSNAAANNNTPGTKTNYNYLRKVLRLIMDEVKEQDPNDIAYVYSGYAPLSIRIIQCILQKSYIQSLNRSPFPLTPASTGWQGFEDVLKSAKGPTFTITQKAFDERLVKARDSLRGGGGWKTIYIMFLGGITFTEIAALRFVGRQLEGEKKRLMICTTGIVSGNKVMERVMEKRGFGAGA